MALLDRGAVLEITNVAGETALTLAAGGSHAKCVRLLLAWGANVSLRPPRWPLSQYMKHARCPSTEVDELLAGAGLGEVAGRPKARGVPQRQNYRRCFARWDAGITE